MHMQDLERFFIQGERNALAIAHKLRYPAGVTNGEWYLVGNIITYIIGLRGRSDLMIRISACTRKQVAEYSRLWRAGFKRLYGYGIPNDSSSRPMST